MDRKGGGCCAPFRGGVESQSNSVTWAEAYLLTKWHLDPSNRLATIRQRYSHTDRTDRQDRQRSYSTVRTILKTVSRKLLSNDVLYLCTKMGQVMQRGNSKLKTKFNVNTVNQQSLDICGRSQ